MLGKPVESTEGKKNYRQSITALSESAKDRIRKHSSNGYYRNAAKFSMQWGDKFVKLVFSNINAGEKVKIAVIMGGAEYLGYYLRAVADRDGIENIDFVELYLTTAVVSPWTAYVVENGRRTIRHKGIGDIPESLKQIGRRRDGRNEDEEIIEYVTESGVFEGADKILVVDTGFNGTMAEVVNTAAKSQAFNGDMIGVLLHHHGPTIVKNNIRILSLNNGVPFQGDPEEYSSTWWAHFIDEGWALFDRFGRNYGLGFQRSRPSPSNLVRGSDGKWEPDTKPYEDSESIFNFQSMLLGIEDAVFGR